MDVVLLAVIGLVVLLGLVAIGIGNKGWSWGTVTAAVLLLFAATGYIYLAARLAERERAWRTIVARNQVEIDRIIGSGGPGAAASPKSLAALRHERDRWLRAMAFVDTWHGRTWEKASFNPPRDGKTGTISIEMPSEEAEASPLAAGAEVAVFDDANIADEGRFLGLFRVQAVNAAKGAENCLLTIVPASTPAPPSADEAKLWTRDYDEVTVYESMPVDRWLAFHKTPAEDADGADDEEKARRRWMPQPRKASAEDVLGGLEQQMAAFEQHDSPVPESDWSDLNEKLKSNEIPPGRYWAVVEFSRNVKFTKKDKFTPDDGPAEEPGAEDDEDEEDEDLGPPGAPVGPPGTAVGDDSDAEPGDLDKDGSLDATAGAVTRRFKQKRFKEGEIAEFDLQTAVELRDDKDFCRILRVFERRPLTDPFTAIRGGELSGPGEAGQPLRALGIDALRQALMVEMASIDAASMRINSSRENVVAQAESVAEEAGQLKTDLESWGKDVTAGDQTAQAFDDRLRAATIELAALENSIVRLGRELSSSWATLTETIDAAAPAPERFPR